MAQRTFFGFREPAPVVEPPRDFRRVHLLDTSVASDNLGDEVIVESARAPLRPLFASDHVTSSSSHDGLGDWGRPEAMAADHVILLGTNALSAADQRKMHRFIWTVRKPDMEALAGKVTLLGVGANRHFEEVDARQAKFLSRLLSPDHLHSVRDTLGARIVEAAGHRAINTSCPTLWRFAEAAPALPRTKARSVCFTLTAHKQGPEDAAMVERLRALYERVYFWPQQPRDLGALDGLPGGRAGITVLPPNLAAYDRLLAEERPDVTGTRLHGSIRGLHHGCRALVIVIDNRAAEIGRETGLPVLMRDAVPERLAPMLESDFARLPEIPAGPIARFLDQFRR